MITLRLFHVTDPFRPIETRTFSAGQIELGRDPAAGWPVEDSACELSRRHCRFHFKEGVVSVRDLSANGVFIGARKRRIERDCEYALAPEEPVYLGQFMVMIEHEAAPAKDCGPRSDDESEAAFNAPLLREPQLNVADIEVGEGWAPADRRGFAVAEAPWLEAFCEGAGIDASAFAGEDPADVARRAGAAYRHAVIGLCDLLGERGALKSHLEMDRTTIGARDNNPFKWADPHRIAIDLLRSGGEPFLQADAAVKASFEDMKRHLICLMAGSRAAVAAAFEEISPVAIEHEAKSQSPLFKGEAYWRTYIARHASALASAHEDAQGPITRAFRTGYERQNRKLDGVATLT